MKRIIYNPECSTISILTADAGRGIAMKVVPNNPTNWAKFGIRRPDLPVVIDIVGEDEQPTDSVANFGVAPLGAGPNISWDSQMPIKFSRSKIKKQKNKGPVKMNDVIDMHSKLGDTKNVKDLF